MEPHDSCPQEAHSQVQCGTVQPHKYAQDIKISEDIMRKKVEKGVGAGACSREVGGERICAGPQANLTHCIASGVLGSPHLHTVHKTALNKSGP